MPILPRYYALSLYTLSRKHITVGEIKNNQLIPNPKRFYTFGTQMCNMKNI